MLVGLIVDVAFDVVSDRNLRVGMILFGFVALVPAACGFVVVRKIASVFDAWRVRGGRDVYRERAYQDDSGFIHLNEVPKLEAQRDLPVSEVLSEMKPVLVKALKDPDNLP